MRNIEFDKAAFEWSFYGKLRAKFKLNLRHLFANLDFAGLVEDAPLLEAVAFLPGDPPPRKITSPDERSLPCQTIQIGYQKNPEPPQSRIPQQRQEGSPVCAGTRFFIRVFTKDLELPRQRQFAQLPHLVGYRLTAIVGRHARVERRLYGSLFHRWSTRHHAKDATNGRFCPHDLRLSILRNHWASHDAANGLFVAHRLCLGAPQSICPRSRNECLAIG
jgi:hypothetical protein